MKSLYAALIAIAAGGIAGSASAQSLFCLNSGASYTPGQIVCIPGCHGAQRLARCDVVNGATAWTTVSENCPTANVSPISPMVLALLGRELPLPR
jgi:hypothetical protein